MAELSARHLVNAGASRVLIANRTEEGPSGLAQEFNGVAVPFERLADSLGEADVVICSTGAPDYVVDEKMMRVASEQRRNRPTC